MRHGWLKGQSYAQGATQSQRTTALARNQEEYAQEARRADKKRITGQLRGSFTRPPRTSARRPRLTSSLNRSCPGKTNGVLLVVRGIPLGACLGSHTNWSGDPWRTFVTIAQNTGLQFSLSKPHWLDAPGVGGFFDCKGHWCFGVIVVSSQ